MGPTITCWDCRSTNTADRTFCANCGVWLHTARGGGASVSARPRTIVADPTLGAPPFLAAKALAPRKHSRLALLASVIVFGAIGAVGLGYGASFLDDAAKAPGTASVSRTAPAANEPNAEQAEDPQAAVIVASDPVETEEPVRVISGEIDSVTPAELQAILEQQPNPTPTTTPLAERAVATNRPRSTPRTAATPRPKGTLRSSGWVCDGDLQISDPGGGIWRITKVGFQNLAGSERVILNLERTGTGGGKPASATATSSRGSGGSSVLNVQLEGGFRNTFTLRRYRPSGMQIVREVSVNPAAISSRVTIGNAGDGCFRLVSPVWRAASNQDTAQIYVDVRR